MLVVLPDVKVQLFIVRYLVLQVTVVNNVEEVSITLHNTIECGTHYKYVYYLLRV